MLEQCQGTITVGWGVSECRELSLRRWCILQVPVSQLGAEARGYVNNEEVVDIVIEVSSFLWSFSFKKCFLQLLIMLIVAKITMSR